MHARRCKGVGWLIKERNSKEEGDGGREVASGFFKKKQGRREQETDEDRRAQNKPKEGEDK
jgi:hypothetical protein